MVACERNGETATRKISAIKVIPVLESRPSRTKTASVTSTGATTAAGVT